MAMGPGRYGDLAEKVRAEVGPNAGVILLIIDGNRGSGFENILTFPQMLQIPRVLRIMADAIEKSYNAGEL